MFNELDFSPGVVVFNDFYVIPDLPYEEQIFSFKEDMFQVNYYDEYLIDIGWNPEFDLSGNFKVRIIKHFDWSNPIYFEQTNDLKVLYKLVEDCTIFIKKITS